MKESSFFFSCSGSHIAFEWLPNGVILSAWASECIHSFGFEVSVHKTPCPGWVVCTRAEYEAIRNQALAYFGLLDQNALFLAQIEAFEAEETACC